MSLLDRKKAKGWLTWDNISTILILFTIGNDILALTGVGIPFLFDDVIALGLIVEKFYRMRKK